MKILLIEDDRELSEMIARYLTEQGFRVVTEDRGDRAVERIAREQPALVVLDLMLPGEDGLSICRRARPTYRGPILMLTARGDDMDEVVGLELGADDYVPKPVRPRVLLAHIRALLRRSESSAADEPLAPPRARRVEIGDIVVDDDRREVRARGQPVELTSGEYDLLWLLISHAGQTLGREYLLEQLRGAEYDGLDRSIDLRVSKLRQKIGDIGRSPRLIKTVRGVGYLYVR